MCRAPRWPSGCAVTVRTCGPYSSRKAGPRNVKGSWFAPSPGMICSRGRACRWLPWERAWGQTGVKPGSDPQLLRHLEHRVVEWHVELDLLVLHLDDLVAVHQLRQIEWQGPSFDRSVVPEARLELPFLTLHLRRRGEARLETSLGIQVVVELHPPLGRDAEVVHRFPTIRLLPDQFDRVTLGLVIE